VAGAHQDALAVVEGFRGAYERKDLQAVMALVGADVRERTTVGRAAVEQLYARNFAVLDGIRYEVTDLELQHDLGSDELVVRAHFRIRATRLDPAQGRLEVAGPIRWVLRREAGGYRIVAIDYELTGR
jgi:ketosteroid isomerase-like protein